MRPFYFTILFILCSVCSFGQTRFYDATTQILGEEELFSTICIGVEDLDGDFRDDLFVLDEGKTLKTFIQDAPDQSFEFVEHLQVSAFGDWSFLSGDLDNDGVAEIICSGIEDGAQFLRMQNGTFTTYSTVDGDPSIYAQNSNLVDLDNDGFLDFFVCNDDGESVTFINDGTGVMNVVKLIDFQTSPEDDMSGNYTSIFTDIDNDNDLDLYIGKCKAGVTDPTDPRRINTLYINNGDGTYTEDGEARGLDNGSQTWSVDSGDVDNDGDVDIIIANHDRAHDLMINDGDGNFERLELIPGGYVSFAYQSFFCDFDNNGWLDIFITDPSQSYILYNDEMSFTKRDLFDSGFKPFSGASGDLNSDGFPDLHLGYAASFQTPSLTLSDKILLNEGNTNNYLDIKLIGTLSNRDAVGAKITLHQGTEIQSREIVVGKSYGIMNSTMVHFGLGKSSVVDSISILWPSGSESLLTEIPKVNTVLIVKENECSEYIIDVPNYQLCNDEAVEITLPAGYDSYQWSNGAQGQVVTIDSAGWYKVELIKDGCKNYTSYFEVMEEIDLGLNEVLNVPDQIACDGDLVKLKAHPGIAYAWSTNDNTQEIEVFESGKYSLTLTTNCGDFGSRDVEVLFADTKTPIIINDTILLGEKATFIGAGQELNWYQNKNDEVPLATGNEFTTPDLFTSQTFYVGEPTSGNGYFENIMINVPLNQVSDTSYSENDTVQFSVFQDVFINSIDVRTQVPGERKLRLLQDETEIATFDVDLIAGVNTIAMEYQLEAGNYYLTTDPMVNQMNLGTEHPAFSFSEVYTAVDKSIFGYLEISDSQLYPGLSPYFFNWDMEYGSYYCEPRIAVEAVVVIHVSAEETNFEASIFPNPTTGQISIVTDLSTPYEIQIVDLSGRQIGETKVSDQQELSINLPNASGIYFIKLANKEGRHIEKVYRY